MVQDYDSRLLICVIFTDY